MVSPAFPIITPTLPFGISIFLLAPGYPPYETGMGEGAIFEIIGFCTTLSTESKPEPPFSTLGRFASVRKRAAISCARCFAISKSLTGGGTLL
jgi:hypothetical protein